MLASLTSTNDTSSRQDWPTVQPRDSTRQDEWDRQDCSQPGTKETGPRPALFVAGRLLWVGGWVGAPLDLGFLICTREDVPNPSAGPSAHAVHYQDSRLESSQERPDSSALRRWEAGWAAPLGLMCSSGRGLGIPVSHRQSFHRLTEVISYHRGVTNVHALELSPGWRP